jgi:hypothetical protein
MSDRRGQRGNGSGRPARVHERRGAAIWAAVGADSDASSVASSRSSSGPYALAVVGGGAPRAPHPGALPADAVPAGAAVPRLALEAGLALAQQIFNASLSEQARLETEQARL